MSQSPRAVAPSLNGWNAEYLDAQYEQYRADPAAISPDLAGFFQWFFLALARLRGVLEGQRSVSPDPPRVLVGASRLIGAYRRYGHLSAAIDPSGPPRPPHHSFSHAALRLTEADFDHPVVVGDLP